VFLNSQGLPTYEAKELGLDAIPDIMPGGFVDDAGVISVCLTTVDYYVTAEHIKQAEIFLKQR
jgi:uncharacterized membrane protein YkvA (DUF1232 family)